MTERAAWSWLLVGGRDGAQLARCERLPLAAVHTVALLRLVCLDEVPLGARVAYVTGFVRGYRAVRERVDINEETDIKRAR